MWTWRNGLRARFKPWLTTRMWCMPFLQEQKTVSACSVPVRLGPSLPITLFSVFCRGDGTGIHARLRLAILRVRLPPSVPRLSRRWWNGIHGSLRGCWAKSLMRVQVPLCAPRPLPGSHSGRLHLPCKQEGTAPREFESRTRLHYFCPGRSVESERWFAEPEVVGLTNSPRANLNSRALRGWPRRGGAQRGAE